MRFFKNVFTTLAVYMIGFGILVGILFPFFTLCMGIPRNIVLTTTFFIFCVVAGILVGTVNIVLTRVTVKKRLNRLSNSMIKVEQRLKDMSEDGEKHVCHANDCHLPIDSNDEFGISANAFNQLLTSFEQSLRTQNALRQYNRTLTSELEISTLTANALNGMITYTNASTGAIFVVKTGHLSLAASKGIKNAELLGENEQLLSVLKSKHGLIINFPSNIVIDGLLADIHPSCIIVEPIIYKDTVLGIILLANTQEFSDETYQHLDMFSNNLALALNNSLKHSQLQTLVALDPLTGVYNRRFGFTRLSEEFSTAVRSGAPIGLLMLDIDHFKRINDTYGHIAGDKVLVDITSMAKAVLRKYDILIRYGGEEFVAVLPGASTQDTMVVADRLRSLAENSIIPYGDHKMYVTVSIGVVSYPETEISDSDELIKHADDALYRAKEMGRNRVILYDDEAIENT